MNLRYKFVGHMPEKIKEGVLYISISFGTMIHKCGCGCGEEVVTPLGPAEWKFTYDGKTISVRPSIGNWSFPCRSHYWIRKSRVLWARSLTEEEVLESRAETKERLHRYYSQEKYPEVSEEKTKRKKPIKLWTWIKRQMEKIK